jgi:arylsulfatase A-like enzyme
MEDMPYIVRSSLPRGWHREEGIFLAYGPFINKGKEINESKIYDIAPTILHLMEVPVPKDMDGKVLKDIFQEWSAVARREVAYQEAEGEEEIIRERIGRLRKAGKI